MAIRPKNKWQRALLAQSKIQGVLALFFFTLIAVVGPFRGAPPGIAVASAVCAVLTAAFLWFKLFRPSRGAND